MTESEARLGAVPLHQRRKRPFPLSLFTRRNLTGYAFVGPWALGFLVFTLLPFIASIWLSLTEWDLVNPPVFVGFLQFRKMFVADKLFRITLFNTFYYSTFSVPGIQILGLALAVILNQQLHGMALYRTLFYLPAITPGIASAFLWMQLFNPRIGMINNLLSRVGIDGPNWLNSMTWSMPALIVMSLWGCGGAMVIYLAGLQGVPTHLYEAAEVDGASAWRRFWSVTLPLITPTAFFNLVMGIIGSFQVFTSAFIMTGGGPAYRTLFYTLYLFQEAFYNFRMGYASALAWFLFLVVMLLTMVQLYLSKHWVYYEAAPQGRGVA
ncbi:MAG: sugar ABC transporter permease [Chloroflexota bacterium]